MTKQLTSVHSELLGRFGPKGAEGMVLVWAIKGPKGVESGNRCPRLRVTKTIGRFSPAGVFSDADDLFVDIRCIP